MSMIRYTLSVLEMWSFTVYFTVNRRSLIHPIPAQGSLFPLESYSKKTLKKMPRRALVNTKRNVLMPPGHPIILLKSNLFNMAAESVKWSIAVCINLLQVCPSGPHLLWYLCILFMSGAVIYMFCWVWWRFLLFQCCWIFWLIKKREQEGSMLFAL